mmetsp:Transcript_1349/g.1949  ORF Transcript_1349/g.1949 Transcript_1349/m.1949 type:complete len:258 (-) Transcript_1349:858-1631(-)
MNKFAHVQIRTNVLETNMLIGSKAIEVTTIIVHTKVTQIDIKALWSKLQHVTSERFIRRRILHLIGTIGIIIKRFCGTANILYNLHLDRRQSAQASSALGTQLYTRYTRELLHFDHVHGTRSTNASTKRIDNIRRISTTAKTRNGRHTTIIPPTHITIIDQLEQTTFAEHRIRQIQTRHLINFGPVQIQSPEHPKIRFTPRLKLQRTNTVINVLQAITNTVRKIIRRINAPHITNVRMRHILDTIRHKIIHVRVAVI